ncbi:MAG: transcriptional regulator TrmB [Candidatus Taylorbacteria bacterium]|nr:transcriptional regulator TrmB [Candidatus Taylorbacteria bacterium]
MKHPCQKLYSDVFLACLTKIFVTFHMKQILKKIGLSETETSICVALVGKPPMPSANIASSIGIPRQTAYSILIGLAEKGLVVQTAIRNVKHFHTDKLHLSAYLKNEQERMAKLRKELQGEAASTSERIRPMTGKLPKVEFYDGSMGQERLLESILDIYKRGKSKMFRGYGINYFTHAKGLENYLKYFIQKRASYKVDTRLFIAKGPDGFNIRDEKSAYRRTVKHLDIDPQMAGIYFVANRAYFFSYADNVGIMIENQSIVSMLKHVFDDHWKRVEQEKGDFA